MKQTNTSPFRQPRVTVIDPRAPEKAKLRIAAYARVSSDSDDQVNSYIAQVDYYTKFIASHEDWEMVDIYADEGISGLDTKKRDDFNRMMDDCRAGKIDRILVKSMSRFARNTKDHIQYMRELLQLGVSIRFEKENIDTGKMTSEQIAQIYGAFAQMESTNHSNNMRISVKMRMEKGLFTPPSAPFGYRLMNHNLEINLEEAAIVRQIYAAYLNGKGFADIACDLNASAVKRGRLGAKWYPRTVHYILTNISYTGDMIWQKTFATSTLPFRQVPNKGQRPKYFVEDCQQPIVSKNDFQRVQDLIAVRREQFHSAEAEPQQSIYRGHICCGACGAVFRQKIDSGKIYWVCNRRNAAKSRCPVPQIPEAEITAAVLRLYNKLRQENGIQLLRTVLSQLKELRELELRSNRKISDIDKEIAKISEQNLVLVRLKSKGYVDSALYLSQQSELDHRLKNLRRLRRRILESASEDSRIQATQMMLDYLEDGPAWRDEVEPEMFEYLIDKLLVISATEVKIGLKNGLELTEQMERAVR